ncbi:kelch domain-containing protein 3 isoform X2 [Capsicum annuum]|uniref:kelch domain-containing protein 3 isoform X2 n=1 Tax=Capsicum annuum TaxID=4072 RepID=UPI001FB15C04|nr:kelch domain-containing protein 3 isoform X2 [Capsicum annuum]
MLLCFSHLFCFAFFFSSLLCCSSLEFLNMMRWERVAVHGVDGASKRWSHTCNAVQGGRLLYVFGGYDKDDVQTNKVHVFDTVNRIWSEPLMNGGLPSPRSGHSCTTIGNDLIMFGGTNGTGPLNDLHILFTSSNTWVSPDLIGDAPNPREGHSAALIGHELFIFGGCAKFDDAEIYYDDIHKLDIEKSVWMHIVPSGTPPSKREGQSCSCWNRKIIVIGGRDKSGFYQSDVHIFDTETFAWCKLNTTGHILQPRTWHTTISLGRKQFVFGGFDHQSLFDDVYVLDVAARTWREVFPIGQGPSARFSVAGDFLDPHQRGVLAFTGGCGENLQPLEDVHYLHTGLAREAEPDIRRIAKLSLMEQLHLKFQKQYNNALFRFGINSRGKILLNGVSQISHKHLHQKDAMDSLMKGRTTLVTDRRLSTVESANNVAVVSDGQIVESGTHDG